MTEPTAVPSVPKAELHVHLEAGAAPELVRRNAVRYGVDVSRLFDEEGRYLWTDFSAFLVAYDLAASVFRTPEDFAEIAEVYQRQAAAAGSIYTEFFVSPDFGIRSGLGYRTYLDGIVEGLRVPRRQQASSAASFRWSSATTAPSAASRQRGPR
jgi:adenosine deaminase (EC 3.5.4.4)